MGVRQASKHDLAAEWRGRHWKAKRRERIRLLDDFVATTGYHRKYATMLLRHGPPKGGAVGDRRGHPVVYGPAVLAALEAAAEAAGWICGKRLAPFLEELVVALEQEGALVLTAQVRAQLLGMSAATIDRRLRTAKAKGKPRGYPPPSLGVC